MKTPGFSSWNPGLMMISVPMNPMMTAIQRRMPTCSPSTSGDSMVTMRGWTKKIDRQSAIGR